MTALLSASVLGLTAIFWIVRQTRARRARRLQHAFDIYAEREIARQQRSYHGELTHEQ